jgi:tetratricopeptide (TPR) repeat protein
MIQSFADRGRVGMADIFLSCEREQQERAWSLLRSGISAHGWSVWTDTDIGAGKPWAEAWARLVDVELAAAKCVLAIWTGGSVGSAKARHCALQGFRRGCLVQVVLDGAIPPQDFRSTVYFDLSSPRRRFPPDARFEGLTASVRRTVGGEGDEHQKRMREATRARAHGKLIVALASSELAEAREHEHRGFQHRLRAEFACAIADCGKAIAIDAGFAKAYQTRAIAYHESGLYERAIDDLSRLIELEPGYFGGYSLRGIARVHLKDFDHAIADFDRAIALETEDDGTYYGRGLACHGAKAYDAAISSYTKAIEKASEYGRVPYRYYRARAQAYEERGLADDRACAELDYVRTLRLAHPTDVAAEEGLARLRGDVQAAPIA